VLLDSARMEGFVRWRTAGIQYVIALQVRHSHRLRC